MRALVFQFIEPVMYKLSEWKPYIPQNHYHRGDAFTLRGRWPLDADRVILEVVSFTDSTKKVYNTTLKKRGDEWSLTGMKLTFDEGLYRSKLTACRGKETLSDTEFTFYIAPENIDGRHPRVWFDAEKKKWVEERLACKVYLQCTSRSDATRKEYRRTTG